jgi:hypothetical protein
LALCGIELQLQSTTWSPTLPSGVAPSTPIKDLWCTWYADSYPPGGQVPSNFPPEDGKVWGGASMGCGPDMGCVQHVKVEYCVQNLQISACGATLEQLEDCVRTIFRQCSLEGHGCGPLRACGSACDDTIVQLSDAGFCELPIE